MDESWIKKYLSSPLQSTSPSQNAHSSSSFAELNKINLQNFTPLNVPLPSPSNDIPEMGRTPLSRRIDLHKEIIRKRPFSFLENDPQSVYLNGKIESPKTPRYAVKILKKIGYENKSDCYLVQWNGGSAGEADPSTTWEWANQLAPNCRKMVADFESSIATDPKKAWEFTDYEVEAILDRTVQGQLRYLVKWVGWRVPTWEKVKHLLPDYGELIEEFEKLNMKDIQFWTNTKRTGKGKRSMEDDLEEAEESFTEKDNGTTEVQLPISQKFPTSSSATAAIAVKAVKVLNKLDRNKERASYLMLWPEEAGERSNGEPNKSWEKRISLGTVEAILKFEEAIKKRKVWAREAVMYEVETVLGRRKTAWAEAPQYLVKWKGYNEISWAPMESLQICFKHLLVAYALERPRTLEKGRMEASEIKRMKVPKRVKDEFGRINKRLNARLHSSFEKFKCND